MQKTQPAFPISQSGESAKSARKNAQNDVPSGALAPVRLQMLPGAKTSIPAGSTQFPAPVTGVLLASQLDRHATDWLYDCQFRQHSPRTIEFRRHTVDKLLWFLAREKCHYCDTASLRRFLSHVANGHNEGEGRFGDGAIRSVAIRPASSATLHRFYRELRTLFGWLVREEIIAADPMGKISPPLCRSNQVQPFTPDQVQSLLAVARRSSQSKRDEAILLFLFDTGARASELCGLRMCDLDLSSHRATVTGKGRKTRLLFFGRVTAKAIWQYLRETPREPHDSLFRPTRGYHAGTHFTPAGLLHFFQRLGKAARIQSARCSPHTARHTFAVTSLRNGGNVFTLQQMLGHTSLAMTRRYVALAEADMEAQHREYSPMDRLEATKGGKRGS